MSDQNQSELDDELRYCAQNGDHVSVERLIDIGANVNAFDELGRTALHYAVLSNESRLVHLLLERKASVNAYDEERIGDTAIMLAAENGLLKIVKMLLNAGADPYITGWLGRDALDLAERCQKQDGSKVRNLILKNRPPPPERKNR